MGRLTPSGGCSYRTFLCRQASAHACMHKISVPDAWRRCHVHSWSEGQWCFLQGLQEEVKILQRDLLKEQSLSKAERQRRLR